MFCVADLSLMSQFASTRLSVLPQLEMEEAFVR